MVSKYSLTYPQPPFYSAVALAALLFLPHSTANTTAQLRRLRRAWPSGGCSPDRLRRMEVGGLLSQRPKVGIGLLLGGARTNHCLVLFGRGR